ncbi:MAG: hypothetical protein C0500_15280, partial [Sphingobium sp.]|nr:hypothetical protein [Sphingobium sp.]
MAQGQRSVTFRLGTSGAAEVKNDFKAVGDAGEDAARRLGARFQRETATAEAAAKKAADTAAKLAA